MTDGERHMQQLTSDGSDFTLYDEYELRASYDSAGKCANPESTSPGSPGGNGYVGSTSSSPSAAITAASTTSPHHPSSNTFTSNASPGSGVPIVVKMTEEPSSSAGSRKDDTMQSTSSDASTDTFHTPSASLQNLSGSRMIDKNRRISEFLEDQRVKEKPNNEEERENVTDPGITSTTISDAATETESQNKEQESSRETGEVHSSHQPSQETPERESRQQHSNRQSQQHKRQSSAGSQCSLSSNPENSQFKTADAHSSDSDASRNSAPGIFDRCTAGGSGGGGRVDYMREDPDRKSLQSDNSHSHSGEQLNTSAESVEFAGASEVALRRSEVLTPRISEQLGSASPTQIHSSGSKPRVKKKMWYQQIFSTSYKTRSGDFKKIFKNLPSQERLIVDYSCALQKEILLQGRMYVSQNYVSFYANIFGWETQMSTNFKDIESITKEKTALIIPNAIGITTMSEKFFFSSFVTRDTTYVMLFKLWQSALLDDNISKKELWRLVHTCYGEELGVTSEDEPEDMYMPLVATSTVSTLITTTEADDMKSVSIDPEVCGTEIGPAIAVGLNIGSSIVTSNGIPIGTEQLLVKDSNIVPLPVSVLPMTVEPSDSSDTEAVDSDLRPEIASIVVPLPSPDLETVDLSESAIPIVPPVCPVDHTIGKEMLNAVIPCGIDQLFTMLFTSSKFYLDFQTSRKTFDMNQCEWQLKDGSHKTRQLSFTVLTGQSLGPKTAQVTETQTLLPASRPGLLYAIQSESVNAGIPYADAFSVNCHYCLTRVSPHESNITVISKIHYKKSVWAKSFIEKNSMAALADFFSHLERALKEECAKSIAGNITPISPVVVSSLPRRRHRKKCRAPDIPASAMTRALNLENSSMHSGGTLRSTINTAMPDILSDASSTDVVEGSLVMKIILTVLGCLLLLNAFLYFKLSSLERTANLSVLYPPAVQFSGEAPQTHQEWLMLLQQQETLHRTEVQGWHEILVSAIKILHQAEKDLESLKSHISTYGTGNVIVKPIIPRDTSDLFYSSTKTEKSESELPSPATVTSGKDKTTTQTQPKENLPIDVGGDAISSD